VPRLVVIPWPSPRRLLLGLCLMATFGVVLGLLLVLDVPSQGNRRPNIGAALRQGHGLRSDVDIGSRRMTSGANPTTVPVSCSTRVSPGWVGVLPTVTSSFSRSRGRCEECSSTRWPGIASLHVFVQPPPIVPAHICPVVMTQFGLSLTRPARSSARSTTRRTRR
jgi:hypothetical protein